MGRREPFPCQGRSNRVGEINRSVLIARTQLPADAAIIVRQLGACRTRRDMGFQLLLLLAGKLPVDKRADKVSGIFTPHQCWSCGFSAREYPLEVCTSSPHRDITVRSVAPVTRMISVNGIPLTHEPAKCLDGSKKAALKELTAIDPPSTAPSPPGGDRRKIVARCSPRPGPSKSSEGDAPPALASLHPPSPRSTLRTFWRPVAI